MHWISSIRRACPVGAGCSPRPFCGTAAVYWACSGRSRICRDIAAPFRRRSAPWLPQVTPGMSLPILAAVMISAALALAAAGEIAPCGTDSDLHGPPAVVVLDDVGFACRRSDADTKASDLVVPEDMLVVPGYEGVDDSLGDFGYGALLFILPFRNQMGFHRMQTGAHFRLHCPDLKTLTP